MQPYSWTHRTRRHPATSNSPADWAEPIRCHGEPAEFKVPVSASTRCRSFAVPILSSFFTIYTNFWAEDRTYRQESKNLTLPQVQPVSDQKWSDRRTIMTQEGNGDNDNGRGVNRSDSNWNWTLILHHHQKIRCSIAPKSKRNPAMGVSALHGGLPMRDGAIVQAHWYSWRMNERKGWKGLWNFVGAETNPCILVNHVLLVL